uniref:Ras and Rab interactor 3 n=1 Tax=Tetraodon nigroviridis TaxID=99883 RepID=H3DN52_TETNG
PPQLLTLVDRLVESASVWKPKGLSEDQIQAVLERTTAGTFLIQSKEDNSMTLSVRLSEGEEGAPRVHSLLIKQHKAHVHLDGSSLVFDDVFKLVSFYCISRDILAIPLRLPQAITTATKREELEVISAMGADFWTSGVHQQENKQDQSKLYLYVNPIAVEESSFKAPDQPLTSTHHTSTDQPIASVLQNGEASQNLSPEVKDPEKGANNQDVKYKRPPPRPPSVSAGSGMGLLFTSTPPHTSSSPSSAAKKKEEVKGSSGAEDQRKSASPASGPLHSRGAPPLPPAPLCRISSRKSSNRDAGDGRGEREGTKSRKEKLKERQKVNGRGEKTTQSEEDGKEKPGSHCPPPGRKPSRPVPPPRRKPCDSPACTSQTTAPNQGAGTRAPAPAPARRPDVSLYSPQGGTVIGTDPESCSSSSTEEEGDPSPDQEQQNHAADSRSTKVTIKRIPTTMMLDRARHRLSTVLTGLISHDRRLTQRIVELARDPLSYFGSLVRQGKRKRTSHFHLGPNHSSSTELLQEIRQMVTQLKSYLLQSTELQSMLEPQHQYAPDKLENMVEAALCKSVLKPLREPIYQSLEKLHRDDGSLKQLTDNQSTVLGSTTTALGISTAVPEASAMEKISIKMNKLHLDYSPQRKIDLLLKTCKIIYDSMSISSPAGRAHGADDFLPVMMYVLARSNLSNLQLDVEYMMELMDPSLALGEGSYYLTTTYGAVEHIKSFDQQRSATRQLSREVQDSIHRWERRRTLNQERMTQGTVRDFLTVCCPEVGSNPKTLGVLPSTTVHQLAEQCATRFE